MARARRTRSASAVGACAASMQADTADAIAAAMAATRMSNLRSVDDRLHHRGFEVAGDAGAGRLHHQDANELLLRVDPEVCPERAVPAEAAVRRPPIRTRRVEHHFHRQAESHPLHTLPGAGAAV